MKRSIELFLNDDWLGTATAPAPRMTRIPDGSMSESFSYTTLLTLPRGVNRKGRKQAVIAAEQTMRWHCHCEHDCCGHTYGNSRAEIVNSRTIRVHTFGGRNI